MIPSVSAENLRAIPVGESRLFIGEPKVVTMLQRKAKQQTEVWTVKQGLVTIVHRNTGEVTQAILITKLTQFVNPTPPKPRGSPTGTRAPWKLACEAAEYAGDHQTVQRIMQELAADAVDLFTGVNGEKAVSA